MELEEGRFSLIEHGGDLELSAMQVVELVCVSPLARKLL
jgi:hypothetical protein